MYTFVALAGTTEPTLGCIAAVMTGDSSVSHKHKSGGIKSWIDRRDLGAIHIA